MKQAKTETSSLHDQLKTLITDKKFAPSELKTDLTLADFKSAASNQVLDRVQVQYAGERDFIKATIPGGKASRLFKPTKFVYETTTLASRLETSLGELTASKQCVVHGHFVQADANGKPLRKPVAGKPDELAYVFEEEEVPGQVWYLHLRYQENRDDYKLVAQAGSGVPRTRKPGQRGRGSVDWSDQSSFEGELLAPIIAANTRDDKAMLTWVESYGGFQKVTPASQGMAAGYQDPNAKTATVASELEADAFDGEPQS